MIVGITMTKHLLVSVVCLLLAHSSAWAAKLSKKELCAFVASQKMHAVLLTQDGEKVLQDIQYGEFDMSDKRDWQDFIPSRNKFKLIIKPKRIVLENFCSMADCVEAEAVRPTCADTREYIVTFSLNPRKFGPGEFDHEFNFWLLDTKEQHRVDEEIKYAFDKNGKGVFHMGFGTITQRKGTHERIMNLLNGDTGPVTIDLLNIGNSPLELGSWEAMEGGTGSLRLNASGCSQIKLPPGGICKLVLDNPTRTPVTSNYFMWHNALEKDVWSVSFLLNATFTFTKTIEYYIKNN